MRHISRPAVLKFVREWIVPYVLIAVVVIPVRSAIADSNWVPTGSMKPTILEGDLVYVNKLAYDLRVPLTFTRVARWADPAPGDIVVFLSPDDVRLIKRVVAGPGDTIRMRDGRVSVNDREFAYEAHDAGPVRPEVYEDPWPDLAVERGLPRSHWVMGFPSRPAIRSFDPVVVPDGHYFMMGDSRDNSHDSRYFGFVPRDRIVGRAQRVIISLDINRRFGPRFDRFFEPLDALEL